MSYTLKYTGSEIDDILDRAVAGGEIDTELAGKQDALTFDDEPKAGSDNPVKSGGIFDAIKNATVLNAYQLLGSQYALDKTPYTYRQTGGGVSVGNRERVKSIIGASIGWNQLLSTASFTNTTTDTRSTLALFALGYGGIANITTTGLYQFLYKPTAASNIRIKHNGSSNDIYIIDTTTPQAVGHVYYLSINFSGVNPTTVGGIDASDMMVSDLTLMLGSAIADYVYAQESGTAGAGVALLKEWGIIDGTYKAYDAGSIKSVSVSAHTTVGVNRISGYEKGGINTADGQENANADACRTPNIPVFTGETYYLLIDGAYGGTAYLFFYDKDGNYVANSPAYSSSTTVALTNPRIVYMRAVFYKASSGWGTNLPDRHDCFNISNAAINGQYFPYEAHTYALNPNGDLRGVLKLDGSNNLYADGDVYTADGNVAVKYGVVDLGTLTWGYQTSGITSPYFDTTNNFGMKGAGACVCALYTNATPNATNTDNMIVGTTSNGSYLRLRNTAKTGSDLTSGHASWLEGVYLVYELATPTSRTGDPYQEIQICADGGTEEYMQTFNVPVGHETEYLRDLVGAIEDIPEAPSADGTYTLQVVVSGGVATYGWASGGTMLSMSAPDIQRAQNVAEILTDEPEAEEPAEEAEEPTEEAEEE